MKVIEAFIYSYNVSYYSSIIAHHLLLKNLKDINIIRLIEMIDNVNSVTLIKKDTKFTLKIRFVSSLHIFPTARQVVFHFQYLISVIE